MRIGVAYDCSLLMIRMHTYSYTHKSFALIVIVGRRRWATAIPPEEADRCREERGDLPYPPPP